MIRDSTVVTGVVLASSLEPTAAFVGLLSLAYQGNNPGLVNCLLPRGLLGEVVFHMLMETDVTSPIQ